MGLKKLLIRFEETGDFFQAIDDAIKSEQDLVDSDNSIFFDSIKTYQSFMTSNKSSILCAISRLKPGSVYELARNLGRRAQHVLAECRSLESHGFIKLVPEKTGRRQLRPKLSFNYDVILIEDKVSMPLAISEKSERLLAEAV